MTLLHILYVRRTAAIALLLAAILPGTARARSPEAPDLSVGIAFAIEADGRSDKYLVSVSASGGLDLRTPTAQDIAVKPRTSFYWNTDGSFERAELELGGKFAQKGNLGPFKTTLEERPIIVVGEDGRSWMIVPSSLLPKVGGYNLKGVPVMADEARDVLKAFDVPVYPEESPRLRLGSQNPDADSRRARTLVFRNPCKPVFTPALIDRPWLQSISRLELDDPTARWGRRASGPEADISLYASWKRFVETHPDVVIAANSDAAGP